MAAGVAEVVALRDAVLAGGAEGAARIPVIARPATAIAVATAVRAGTGIAAPGVHGAVDVHIGASVQETAVGEEVVVVQP
jgi:hypothetical protein